MKLFRKCFRNTLIRDLRFIRPRFRYLYRADFERGTLEHVLGALSRAYHAGHFYPESYLTPAKKLQD